MYKYSFKINYYTKDRREIYDMNWIIDFFAIVLMCSVQGSIVFGIFSLWEKSKLTAGTVRLNYFMLKWNNAVVYAANFLCDR